MGLLARWAAAELLLDVFTSLANLRRQLFSRRQQLGPSFPKFGAVVYVRSIDCREQRVRYIEVMCRNSMNGGFDRQTSFR